MSVDFTAKVIYGFPVSKEEFKNLTQRIDDKTYDEIIDDFINIYEDSDWFFVVKEIARTEEWVEIEHLVNVITPQIADKVIKFEKLFPNRNDRPRYYLIREVW